MGKKKNVLYKRRERFERSEWDCFTVFRLNLFLSARYTLGISELGIHTKNGSRWRGWDLNPRTPKGRDHSPRFFFLSICCEKKWYHGHS